MAEATSWIFLDFKTKQAVLHQDTGECVFVHGHVTGVEGGPFRERMGDGSRELLGSDGRVLDVSVLWKLKIIKETGVEGIQPADKLVDTRLDSAFSLSELSHTHATRVLALPLVDGGEFKCEVYYKHLPIDVDGSPQSFWLAFPWILEYIFGEHRSKKMMVSFDAWRKSLASNGLSIEHMRRSKKSIDTHNRLGLAASFELGSTTCLADAEYSITIPGLLVLLASFACDGRRAIDGGPERAKALIQAFMNYVFFKGLEIPCGGCHLPVVQGRVVLKTYFQRQAAMGLHKRQWHFIL